jgi:esterase/lipase
MPKTGSSVAQATSSLLEARHQSSGLNKHFTDAQSTFPEYIAHARAMIAQAHPELAADELSKVIDGNAPFELKPAEGFTAGKEKTYRRGILLVHGLTDSPYFMRHLAAIFQESGFRVMAVLLPGHGTQPGDLLDVRWQEWARVVAYGVEQLAREADEVYLGGYSAGGALSIYQSLRDKRVHGLFLFAPALKISSRAAWANFHRFYSGLLPAAKWVHINPDRDRYKYESFPKNAAAQMYALTQVLRSQLAKAKVPIPIFTVMSQDDVTVDAEAIIEFMALAPHPGNKLVYYFSRAEKIPARILNNAECVNAVFPEKKIISSAHTALVLPGEDPYYGEQGAYCNCIHYYPEEREKYAAFNDSLVQLPQGEITDENLKSGTMRRLMHNPNFAGLKVALRQFIDRLPA